MHQRNPWEKVFPKVLSCFLFDCLLAAYKRVTGFLFCSWRTGSVGNSSLQESPLLYLVAWQGRWEVVCVDWTALSPLMQYAVSIPRKLQKKKRVISISVRPSLMSQKLKNFTRVNTRQVKYYSPDCTFVTSCTVYNVKMMNPLFSRL